MAYITADSTFLMSIFSFRPMFTESRSTDFFNNQPFGYESLTAWNDAIETAYTAGRGSPFTTAFTGDALRISPVNVATGDLSGTVEGMFTYAGHRANSDLVHAFSIWGFEANLSRIQTVARTASDDDDRALLAEILSGDDTVRLSEASDIVSTFDGMDIAFAGGGSDRIDGGSGGDVLLGQNGFDTLIGGLGDDTLVGGKNADEMRGGLGQDVFVFDDGHLGLGIGARDLVLDWNPREDVLDFSRIDGNSKIEGDQELKLERSYHASVIASKNTVLMYVSGDDIIFRFEVTGDTVPDFDLRMVGAEVYSNYLLLNATAQQIQSMFDL